MKTLLHLQLLHARRVLMTFGLIPLLFGVVFLIVLSNAEGEIAESTGAIFLVLFCLFAISMELQPLTWQLPFSRKQVMLSRLTLNGVLIFIMTTLSVLVNVRHDWRSVEEMLLFVLNMTLSGWLWMVIGFVILPWLVRLSSFKRSVCFGLYAGVWVPVFFHLEDWMTNPVLIPVLVIGIYLAFSKAVRSIDRIDMMPAIGSEPKLSRSERNWTLPPGLALLRMTYWSVQAFIGISIFVFYVTLFSFGLGGWGCALGIVMGGAFLFDCSLSTWRCLLHTPIHRSRTYYILFAPGYCFILLFTLSLMLLSPSWQNGTDRTAFPIDSKTETLNIPMMDMTNNPRFQTMFEGLEYYSPDSEDSPREAGLKIRRLLFDRYGIEADIPTLQELLGKPAKSPIHAYTSGLLKVQDTFIDTIIIITRQRYLFTVLTGFTILQLILLRKFETTRIKIIRGRPWRFRILLTIIAIGTVAFMSGILDYGIVAFLMHRTLSVFYRFYQQHFMVITIPWCAILIGSLFYMKHLFTNIEVSQLPNPTNWASASQFK